MAKAAKTFGLKLSEHTKPSAGDGDAAGTGGDAAGDGDGEDNIGWLGVKMAERGDTLVISKVEASSPLRDLIIPNDELVALDGIRVRSRKSLKAALKGKADTVVKVTLARHDIIMEISTTAGTTPKHSATLTGTGNRLWKALISPQSPK
jgi:predicted metalloprotease with PDZ domain